MNRKRGLQTAVMTLVLACLSLYAALAGLLSQSLYADVVLAGTMEYRMIWGSMAQDMISVPMAVILGVL